MPITARREAILAAVYKTGRARTTDLAVDLGVSEVTIRNDLDALERLGRISRVHGGAAMPEVPLVGFHQRRDRQVEQKQRVAAAASRLIRDDQTIILDSGTTVVQLARLLPTVANLVVYTRGLYVALHLMEVSGVDLRLLGGKLLPGIAATLATATAGGLDGILAHTAFLGAGGIDRDMDVVEGRVQIAETKRIMMAAARRRVLLADSSKWFTSDPHKVVGLSSFDTVITDDGLAPEIRAAIESQGVELVVV
ncbi:MAG: DeoR/GlpR family DNA-binding transcription regulator [Bifidobacteriaceae bacterium]|nr:DeoR/GlpR family DNA-binding transcription regulator [Bifidobacteriaceae bacterium]